MNPQSNEKITYDCVYALNNAKKHKLFTDGFLYCAGNRVSLHSHLDAPVDKCIHAKGPYFGDGDDITVGRYLVTVGERHTGESSSSTTSTQPSASTLLPKYHQPTTTPSAAPYSQQRCAPKPTPQATTAKTDSTKKSFTPLAPVNAQASSSYPKSAKIPKGSINAPPKPTPSYLPKPQEQPRQTPAPSSIPTYSPSSSVFTLHDDPHIYVSAHLNAFLRPHQRDGVKFAFKCILGQAIPQQHGVIIMDDVGLGKTIQAIALMDAMLSYPFIRSKKVVICCPSILVNMWHRECSKWLPPFSFLFTAVTPDKTDKSHIDGFVASQRPHVLILSYEQLRKYSQSLQNCKNVLLICDEAHRLKSNAETKTITALQCIPTKLKILLTATPIQNDLQEFYAMANFAVPRYLSPDLSTFTSTYVKPILAMQDPRNSAKEMIQRQGAEMNTQLMDKIAKFCLRRTHETIGKFLPPKTSFLVFLNLTPLQIQITTMIIELHRSQPSVYQILPVLNLLRKCATSPYLLLFNALTNTTTAPSSSTTTQSNKSAAVQDDETDPGTQTVTQSIISKLTPYLPRSSLPQMIASSTKITLLHKLIDLYSPHTNIIIISSFTETLKYVQSTLPQHSCLSLDGSTDNKTRVTTIETFNNKAINLTGKHYILFLSARAAGAGLNLINGCVQISLDSNWNPAVDVQAQGRMWRTGQTQHVLSFQLITNGSIDEHILLRQIAKNDIASSLLQKPSAASAAASAAGQSTSSFTASNASAGTLNRLTPDELRRVLNFEYHKRITYEMLSKSDPTADLAPAIKRPNDANNSTTSAYEDNSDEGEVTITLAKNKAGKKAINNRAVKRSKFQSSDDSNDINNSSNTTDTDTDSDADGMKDGIRNKPKQTENHDVSNFPRQKPQPGLLSQKSRITLLPDDTDDDNDDDDDWFNSKPTPLPPPPTLPSFAYNSTDSNSAIPTANNIAGEDTIIELEELRGGYIHYDKANLPYLVELTLPVLTTSPATLHHLQQQRSKQTNNNSNEPSSLELDETSPLFQRFVSLGNSIFSPPTTGAALTPTSPGLVLYCLVKQTNFEDDETPPSPASADQPPTASTSPLTGSTSSSTQLVSTTPTPPNIPPSQVQSVPPPPINTSSLLENYSGAQVTRTILKRSIFESSSDED